MVTKQELQVKVASLEDKCYRKDCEISELKSTIENMEQHEEWYKKKIAERENQIHFLAWMLVDKWVRVNKHAYGLDVFIDFKWEDNSDLSNEW